MLDNDSNGRLLLAQERAERLARDYGRLRGPAEHRPGLGVARIVSRRRRRRLYRARAYSA